MGQHVGSFHSEEESRMSYEAKSEASLLDAMLPVLWVAGWWLAIFLGR